MQLCICATWHLTLSFLPRGTCGTRDTRGTLINTTMQVSASISDFPVLRNMDYMFKGMKEAGADGVEIIPGLKSRFSFKSLYKLSNKHSLPITSFHQPPWTATEFFFDEEFFKRAVDIGVTKFTFHPLVKHSFSHTAMRLYFEKLSQIQEKYHCTIMFENMSLSNATFVDRLLAYHPDTVDLKKIAQIASLHHLSLTLDTSHTQSITPWKDSWFNAYYPHIANIHLSSFTAEKDHLPLTMGEFQTVEFIQELKKRNYKGLITLEIFYPKFLTLNNYDFESIKKSIDLIKST